MIACLVGIRRVAGISALAPTTKTKTSFTLILVTC